MNNLYEQASLTMILDPIELLRPDSQRHWGKMSVAQMLAHCAGAMEVACDKKHTPMLLIGRILGPLIKGIFLNSKPFPKNAPTDKSLVVADDRDFEKEKKRLKDLISEFSESRENCTKHPHGLFGRLTPDEWGTGMYKHLDHHLRQFGV